MVNFLILTALVWTALFVILYHLFFKHQISVSWREIFLLVAIVFGLIIVFSTEVLSVFTILTPTAIKITWLIGSIISIGLAVYLSLQGRESWLALREEFRVKLKAIKSMPWQHYLILLLILIQLVTLLVIIYLYPVPSNGDSMRYHLTRILVWEQQASVRHFATQNLHQITLPPFSEYTILHINWITGSDHLARIVQWFALVISIVAGSEVAKKLGADKKQQIITALLCATLPIAILESTSTQTDLVVAAWLVTFMAFALRLKAQPLNFFAAAATGLSLGLALMTKSTAFIFALPFSLYIGFCVFKAEGFRPPTWKAGAIVVILALLINLGHFTRNTITFGTPLGTNLGNVNEVFSIQTLASNVIRDLQLNVPATKNPNLKIINMVGESITKISWNLHLLTGVDVNDPRTTLHSRYSGFDSPSGLRTDETRAGNFIHLTLIGFTIVLSIFRRDNSEEKHLIIVLIITLFLFSFLIKTMDITSRLLLSWFMMWVPLIGLSLFRFHKRFWLILPFLIWAFSLPWVFNNSSRPLIPSQVKADNPLPADGIEAYFAEKPRQFPVFDQITSLIIDSKCSEIGIAFSGDKKFFEYPFWMMLREKGFTGTINHVMVQNESRIYEDLQYSPCIILANSSVDDLSGYSFTAVEDFLIYSKD